jgi:hypothetical protein
LASGDKKEKAHKYPLCPIVKYGSAIHVQKMAVLTQYLLQSDLYYCFSGSKKSKKPILNYGIETVANIKDNNYSNFKEY